MLLVDKDADDVQARRVPEASWLLADACEITALHEAGLAECDVVVAATGDDKANLVVSLLAKTEFGVPRTVARVNNPKNEWMFDEAWGVDVAVSTPRLMTALVEEAVSVGDLVRIFQFQQGKATMVELTLPLNSPYAGSASATSPGPATRCWSASSARTTRSRPPATTRSSRTTSCCSSPRPTSRTSSRRCSAPVSGTSATPTTPTTTTTREEPHAQVRVGSVDVGSLTLGAPHGRQVTHSTWPSSDQVDQGESGPRSTPRQTRRTTSTSGKHLAAGLGDSLRPYP